MTSKYDVKFLASFTTSLKKSLKLCNHYSSSLLLCEKDLKTITCLSKGREDLLLLIEGEKGFSAVGSLDVFLSCVDLLPNCYTVSKGLKSGSSSINNQRNSLMGNKNVGQNFPILRIKIRCLILIKYLTQYRNKEGVNVTKILRNRGRFHILLGSPRNFLFVDNDDTRTKEVR